MQVDALKEWKYIPHGPRVQTKAIVYIGKKLDTYEFFREAMAEQGIQMSLTEVLKDCLSTVHLTCLYPR